MNNLNHKKNNSMTRIFEFSIIILSVLSLVFTSCEQAQKSAVKIQADYVYTNGVIYTVDSSSSWAQSIAILGDSIIYIGNDDAVREYQGPNTKTFDLAGRLMLPGFVDAHAHPLLTAMLASGYMAEPSKSLEDLLLGVKNYAESNPDEKILFGFGGFYMGQYKLTSKMLDDIDDSRPIIMIEDGGHGAWANSKAFEVLGIDENFPDPMPGYSFYLRDEAGKPTGEIMEIAAYVYMLDNLNVINAAKLQPSFKGVAEMMNELGYTSIYDAGVFAPLDEEIYPIISDLAKTEGINLRINASYAVKSMDKLEKAIPKLNEYQKYNVGTFQINTFKSYIDGTLESRTAALYEDYLDTPGNKGTVAIHGEKLYNTLIELAKNNYDIHLHAMGPKAINEVLRAGEKVREAGYHDVTITNGHTQLVSDEDMGKFKEFNIIPNTSAVWHIYSGDGYIPSLGEERFSKLFRYESLAKSGVPVTIGTDYPAAEGGTLGANPLLQMQCAITRQRPSMFGVDTRIQPPIDERMSIRHAIEAFTINGAKQMRLDKQVGSLEVGKKADFVILDKNIFELSSSEIITAKVVFTMFNGNVVHDMLYKLVETDNYEDVNLDVELCDEH